MSTKFLDERPASVQWDERFAAMEMPDWMYTYPLPALPDHLVAQLRAGDGRSVTISGSAYRDAMVAFVMWQSTRIGPANVVWVDEAMARQWGDGTFQGKEALAAFQSCGATLVVCDGLPDTLPLATIEPLLVWASQHGRRFVWAAPYPFEDLAARFHQDTMQVIDQNGGVVACVAGLVDRPWKTMLR